MTTAQPAPHRRAPTLLEALQLTHTLCASIQDVAADHQPRRLHYQALAAEAAIQSLRARIAAAAVPMFLAAADHDTLSIATTLAREVQSIGGQLPPRHSQARQRMHTTAMGLQASVELSRLWRTTNPMEHGGLVMATATPAASATSAGAA